MFFYDPTYMMFLIPLLFCMILSFWASSKVKSTYAKYNGVRSRMGFTGYDAARRLLQMGGVTDISIGRVSGTLSDHYNPSKSVVNLSDSTYESNSVAAVAVAAHEIGHVMQNKQSYGFYRLRTALVPIANLGTGLAVPLVLLGLLMDTGVLLAQNSDLGFTIAMIGVVFYGMSFLFALVTLPVELNASRRAGQMLLQAGVVSEAEMDGVKDVLSAAAMTYLASMLTSLVYFLRFLFWVLSMFGRRRD